MPRSVFVAVAAWSYLLARLLGGLIQSFRILMGFQMTQGSLKNFVEDITAWDKFFAGLLILGIGIMVMLSLIKGKKLAWWACLVEAYFALIVTMAGYFIGGWWLGGAPPTLRSGFALFLYIIPQLLIATSLVTPSAKAYYRREILWKPFLKRVSFVMVGIILFVIAWSVWTTYLSSGIVAKEKRAQAAPKP